MAATDPADSVPGCPKRSSTLPSNPLPSGGVGEPRVARAATPKTTSTIRNCSPVPSRLNAP